jgi:hypothetical protein
MPRVQFNTHVAYDVKTAWGYPIEVTDEGVFGDVPDELLQIELDAGRVKRIEVKPGVKTEIEPVAEVELPKETTAQDVIDNGTGKRRGRPPKDNGLMEAFGE